MPEDAEAAMRDGTVLRADLYRPPRGTGPWPVLLARGPYGRRDPGILARLDPRAAARRGFLVVVQDVRGRFGSEGSWEPLVHEYDDGYDTVRWAARLPGADGRVAMYGPSYLGHTQWAAITAAPPELAAAVPEFTWADPRDGLTARGGAAESGLLTQWTLGLGHEVLRRTLAGAPDELARALRELSAAQDRLTAGDWNPPVLCALPWPGRPGGPPLRAAPADRGAPCPPTLTVAGWYDAFLQGSLDNHRAARAAGRPAALIVGPWNHEDRTGRTAAHDFGPAADEAALDGGPSLRERTLTWLAAVLAGEPCPGPPVLAFVMGADEWRPLDHWPPPATPTAWYLRAGGALSPEPPGAGEPPAGFRHDPADPVPTRGGALLLDPTHPAGPYDQRPIEARGDVLVHTGEPLAGPLEVMGRVRATLAVAADTGPADWVVRLCDVAPDGTSRVLTDGVARTPAAGPREVRVDLWSTAHVFRPGHRLRVHVAASSHPRWDVAGPPGARTVFRDAARPSRLVLPVTGPVR
ncbi:CocE/NonD family hydrolase [Streptomyces sp. NBC_01477]|uniref:CocE/NonD family hydrolase n=1 Tax=Streptomyces sp. NBC_01477 TaxID=2976015 RepID=UPI002E32FAF3|nr:CocE/NonD family hydrolase [Streptomyces sp. NBC_01477]